MTAIPKLDGSPPDPPTMTPKTGCISPGPSSETWSQHVQSTSHICFPAKLFAEAEFNFF